MKTIKLPSNLKTDNKLHISHLHAALGKLNFLIDEKAMASKKMDDTTVAAIKKIQKENKIEANGQLTESTVRAINDELYHQFITTNKYRIKKLQELFEKINFKIDKAEKENRKTGKTTQQAIAAFQKRAGLPGTGKVSESTFNMLEEAIIKEIYKTKTQQGYLQTTLQKINKVAKLNLTIADKELKDKNLGTTSKGLIKAFQQKYKLPATGEINKATLYKMNSVAASVGKHLTKLKPPVAKSLTAINKTLRLNMVSPQVAELQKNLAFLGYKIAEKEFKTQTFGKTTTKALQALQKKSGIAETGHYDKATIQVVKSLVLAANPTAEVQHHYRIRGSVRNELWQRTNNMVVKIFEKGLDAESATPLGAKKIFLNGFFDIPYDAPVNPTNKQIKEKFHLVVKLYTVVDQQKPVAAQTHYNVNRIHWVNFTESRSAAGKVEYNGKYAGPSIREVTSKMLQSALGKVKIEDLKETATHQQISQVSLQTGLSTDDIMSHVLSGLVTKSVNVPSVLTDEVFYAFVKQKYPASLPDDLLREAGEWKNISNLTELATSGIVFLDDTEKEQVIDNAIARNLVSQKVKLNKAAILQEFKKQKTAFTLTKPILVGNANLQSILQLSTIKSTHYATVANIFMDAKGINSTFWEAVKEHEGKIGADAVKDFANTVEIGSIVSNHLATIELFKKNISTGSGELKKASDLAKLDPQVMFNLIKSNSNTDKVPSDTQGDKLDDKITNFVESIKARAAVAYPVVSLIAAVESSRTPKIKKISEIGQFIDDHEDFEFRNQNIDKYLLDRPTIKMGSKAREELKVIQRAHKITTHSAAAATLIEEGLHSAMQIYFLGKDRLLKIMKAKGVQDAVIHRVYEASKMQYMKIWARWLEFNNALNSGTPGAIGSRTYNKEEAQEVIGDIPNLENLFGSLDYCDCEHCQSLYGPAAYLVDMLRFLGEKESLVEENDNKRAVKDILLDRRPDLGNIKLNCENTDTSLPYIDLVCEILENSVAPQNKNFSNQTTLSSKELKAAPQYTRAYAYSKVAMADFPMKLSFNLWQEEARIYLNHLKVPRFELMEAFQPVAEASNNANNANIAAEFFGLTSKEKYLIVTPITAAGYQEQLNACWNFDINTRQTLQVSSFLERTQLTYNELLELLQLKFVNGAMPVSTIEPLNTCDTSKQYITNLTNQKFDLMHRFIRLWRKTGWKMWELDLLLDNEKLGNKVIDEATLVNLKCFKQLQDRLKLPVETLLAFYGEINRKKRTQPDKPDIVLEPLYNRLFQNQAITNPIDSYLEAIDVNNNLIELETGIKLGVNENKNGYTPVPTILAALAIKQSDFDILVSKTDKQLSVTSLSILFRYTYLARSLKLSIPDLSLLLEITNIANPFSSLQVTLATIQLLGDIKSSGLSLLELSYILNYKKDSPIGLREESTIKLIDSLRKILADYKEKVDLLRTIERFDVITLNGATDDALLSLLAPIQSALNLAKDAIIDDHSLVDHIQFVLQFSSPVITPGSKSKLVKILKSIQPIANNLLSTLPNLDSTQKGALQAITSLNVNGLNVLKDVDLLTVLVPIKNALVVISKNDIGNQFSMDELNFVIQFNRPAILLENKTRLIKTIKLLQLIIGSLATTLPGLNQAQREALQLITSFNANGLSAFNDTDLLGALAPVQGAYTVINNTIIHDISVADYIGFITQFSKPVINPTSKARLIELITNLQSVSSDLITTLSNLDQGRTEALNYITTLSVDKLSGLNDDDLLISLEPVKSALNVVKSIIPSNSFSIDKLDFIVQFNKPSIPSTDKTSLVKDIRLLQLIIGSMLDSLSELHQKQINAHIASSFRLTDEQATLILNELTIAPQTGSLFVQLNEERLLEKNTDGSYQEINAVNFPDLFDAYLLLHKVSLLVAKMKIGTEDMRWFIANYVVVDTLNFSALPIKEIPATANQFDKWRNLYLFLSFKAHFPEPEGASIRSVLDLAKDGSKPKETIIQEIAKLTQWNKDEIAVLDKGLGFQHVVNNLDYIKPKLYHRLLKCFEQMKFTGVDVATMLGWTQITPHVYDTQQGTEEEAVAKFAIDIKTANQIRQAVKSKYEQDDWLEKITPLQDELREKKRAALVAYHLEHSQRNATLTSKVKINGEDVTIKNPLYWKDTNDLYNYLLIDTEMGTCQLTSRIKQALSSVQLFVQRCFLNLENGYVEVTQAQKEDVTSPNAWSQWKWMKNYRVWEANRKIFFYPENWIEPDLRDDKSPFFKDLENELLQNEITKEHVETAFLNYLHKVDEVAHLQVCGIYHQKEDLDLGEAGFETNIVHVIARTKSTPHIYYYRTYDMNVEMWSAWEKVDLDITGDHVIPVVYNRKLHLFWLQFMEKPKKAKKVPAAKPSDKPTDTPEPLKILEIQLCWSIKKSDGWTPKKISTHKLIHPWERPQYAYNLRPYYLEKFNELYLDIYLSTTKEFNDGKFYDPERNLASGNGPLSNPTYLTKNRFDETIPPWHSSSFVFDGDVKDIKLKSLAGVYMGEVQAGDSFTYVHSNYGLEGNLIKELDPAHEYGPRLRLPEGMHFKDTHLTNNRVHAPNSKTLKILEGKLSFSLLTNAPSPFELVIAQQALQFDNLATDHPMFYQDGQRAFFIKVEDKRKFFNNKYWKLIAPIQDAMVPIRSVATAMLDDEFIVNPSTIREVMPEVVNPPVPEMKLMKETSYPMFDFTKLTWIASKRKYSFSPFYHPYTTLFIRELNRGGIDGLLTRKIQMDPQSYASRNTFNFASTYDPTPVVIFDKGNVSSNQQVQDYHDEVVDFSFGGANSIYNWELFFHAPLMIACRLMQNQKFEDAMSWFHYIFNPTGTESYPAQQGTPQRYWVTKPFFENSADDYLKQKIETIISNIDEEINSKQLTAWKNNPFKPHLVARYRPVAYQKNVVMKYLDNLIAWGDMLFKRDTLESINEASLLYMLAYEILGKRPTKVPVLAHKSLTFNELEENYKLDALGNVRVDELIENTLSPATDVLTSSNAAPLPNLAASLYFSIPPNDLLFKYWDTVEDRLFKIRNCMNIEGVVRQLPLFEPPIDPALLVKAAASGVDLTSILSEVAAPTPHYRYRIVVQKAIEFCNEVKALGEKLLSALEKKDAETLSLLRSQHEIQLLEAVKEIRKKQIDEAEEQVSVLERSKAVTEERYNYYAQIEKIIANEQLNLDKLKDANDYQFQSQIVRTIAGGLALIPEFHVGASGFGGTPKVVMQLGGSAISRATSIGADILSILGSIASYEANRASILGGFDRRYDDWKLQERLADKELASIEKQIAAAQIRQAIAEKELENQELQIENAKTVDDYMRNKYTNEQLYSWMITQVSTTYFQAYQLAYDMAKKAERCYQYELGITNSNLIQFGYWDSLKKGLLSGDKLMHDLRRLEAAYIDQNKREFEITKHISLAQMNPASLISLKETGKCTISLPEWWFDMDYPGHYMRRIKNVSISIPCVVGPYTGVNCTLSLLKNKTRMESTLMGGAYEEQEEDNRFKTMFGAISSIATSNAQKDSGMFELSFNDERYLPFEGAGVISDWEINMPIENNHFDFVSLSDVVFHVNYTSRNGGEPLASAAHAAMKANLPSQAARLFDIKHEFGTEWHKFLNSVGDGNGQGLIIKLLPEHYPFFVRGKLSNMDALKITKAHLFIESTSTDDFTAHVKVTSAEVENDLPVSIDPNYNVHHLSMELQNVNALGEVSIKLKIEDSKPLKDVLNNLFVLVQLGGE